MCLEEAFLEDPRSDLSGHFFTGMSHVSVGFGFSIAFFVVVVGFRGYLSVEKLILSVKKQYMSMHIKDVCHIREDIYAIFVGNLSVE